jgi:hypothetical protein
MTLYSNCCNAQDKAFAKVSDMKYSEMGICPNCGKNCGFVNNIIAHSLRLATMLKNDLISITIQHGLNASADCHIELFDYIRSQAKENIAMMQTIIGETLTTKILAI